MCVPGDATPAEQGPPASSPTTTPSSKASKSPSLPTGAIAGIAMGAAVVVLIVITLVYLCGRHQTMNEVFHLSQPRLPAPTSTDPPQYKAPTSPYPQKSPTYSSGWGKETSEVESSTHFNEVQSDAQAQVKSA
jgi:hypothetical protein